MFSGAFVLGAGTRQRRMTGGARALCHLEQPHATSLPSSYFTGAIAEKGNINSTTPNHPPTIAKMAPGKKAVSSRHRRGHQLVFAARPRWLSLGWEVVDDRTL